MKTGNAYRRKKEGKTDYKLRLALVKSGKHRFVIRKTNKNIIAQITEFNIKGDKVIISATSNNLKKFGWDSNRNNVPSAYLTGYLCGCRAIKKNIKEVMADIGLNISVSGCRLYGCIKGAIDSGLRINCDEKMLPGNNRLVGDHLKVKDIKKNFEETKEKIKKNG